MKDDVHNLIQVIDKSYPGHKYHELYDKHKEHDQLLRYARKRTNRRFSDKESNRVKVAPFIREGNGEIEALKKHFLDNYPFKDSAINEGLSAKQGTALAKKDFLGLQTEQSYFPKPHGYVPTETSSKSYSGEEEDEIIRITQSITRAFFSGRKKCTQYIKKISKTGFPFYNNDVELKHSLIDDGIKIIEKEGFSNFFEQYPQIFLIGNRGQAEAASKQRDCFDIKGRKVPMDKTAYMPEKLIKQGFVGRRNRVVYGGTFGNLIFSIISAPFRAYALEEKFRFTFHHDDEWNLKIKDYKYILGFDYKGYDQSIPKFQLIAIYEVLEEIFNAPNMANHFCKMIDILYPDFDSISFDAMLYSARALFGELDTGNTSGIWSVADIAKICAMVDVAYIYLRIGIVNNELDVFKHEEKAVLNSGDDTLLAFNNEREFTAVKEKAVEYSMFNMDLESPVRFLGHFIYDDGMGKRFIPDIASMVIKNLVPEKHYYYRQPVLGHIAQVEYYKQHPSFVEVYKYLDDCCKQVLGVSFYKFRTRSDPEDTIFFRSLREYKPDELINLTLDETIFLDDPSSLQWNRVSDANIRPELINYKFISYSPEQIEDISRRLNVI